MKLNFIPYQKLFGIIAGIIFSVVSLRTYAQTNNSQSSQAVNILGVSANETYNYSAKVLKTENISEVKLYLQTILSSAKQTKDAATKAHELITKQEQEVSNSGNAELIENIKDQREEMDEALEYANRAYDNAAKASLSKDLESIHTCMQQVARNSKKVAAQVQTTEQYASVLNNKKN